MSSEKKIESAVTPNNSKGAASLKEVVSEELDRIGTGGKWVWTLFFLCVTPNILNGFHVSSYVFLGHIPADMWCGVEELKSTNWTDNEIRSLTEAGLSSKGCTLFDWDYERLASMGYEEAFEYTTRTEKPPEVACKDRPSSYYQYIDGASTFVTEWDLVCDQSVHRTSAQFGLSVGKFFGSFSFGILADKLGRRISFGLGAAFYILGSLINTFSPWYSFFLVGRFLLGAASSGLFYAAFTLLSENISVKHRSWMSIAFAASYPVGILLLALAAYLIEPWRYLQFALTVPAFFLILNVYLIPESPRWLLSQNRISDAYKIVFKKKCDIECDNTPAVSCTKKVEKKISFDSIKMPFRQLGALYGPPKLRRMVLTCYFMWCVTSLSYYVTALNAQNLDVNRYLYVAIMGMVDIPSYMLPIILLLFTGRRKTTLSLYLLAGTALLIVLLVPQGNITWVIFFAMLGRFGISAVYSTVTLYTAELFPTEIRNSALGTCSTFSHVGSMSAPYVVDVLGLVDWFLPTTICGSCVLVAGLLTFTLPETSTEKLADRVEDVQDETKK